MAKEQFTNLIWLVETIYRAKRITFAEINRIWIDIDTEHDEIPRSTFCKHISRVQDIFDINIGCDRSTNEYYIEDSENVFDNELKLWLLNSFSLSNVLQNDLNLKARVLFEDVPKGVQFINPIIEGMSKSTLLEVDYKAFDWRHTHPLTIQPYFLRLFKQRWYLIGVNTHHGEVRAWSLDRVMKVSVTETRFKYPRNFVPKKYYADSFGIIKEDYKEAQKTVLKVFAKQVPYIRNLPFHSSQFEVESNDEYSIFELNICHTYDFIQQLLSFGQNLVVVEPISLRDQIVKEIEVMMNNYSIS
jgi:hypothetical protein